MIVANKVQKPISQIDERVKSAMRSSTVASVRGDHVVYENMKSA